MFKHQAWEHQTDEGKEENRQAGADVMPNADSMYGRDSRQDCTHDARVVTDCNNQGADDAEPYKPFTLQKCVL